MRALALTIGLLGLCGASAQAQLKEHYAIPTAEVFTSSPVMRTITIASHTATEVIAAVGFPEYFWGLEVYNISATVSLNCGYSVLISTISTSNQYAREVQPKTGVWFGMSTNPGDITAAFYCMSQGANATSRATITGGR